MEGVGESCCHCVPPGEWVWGAAEEVQGEDDAGSQRWLHQVPGGGGGTGYPSLRVRGAWVVEAGQGRGPLGGGGALRPGLSLCLPPLTSPTRSPLRVLSFLRLRWAGSGSFLVPSKSNHDQVGLFKIVFTWKLSHK